MGLRKFLKNLFGQETELEKAMAAEPSTTAEDAYGAPPDQLTMVPSDDVNDHFIRHKVTFEEILKPGDKVPIIWEYKPGVMTKDMIEDIFAPCGCTAEITWGNKGVRCVFTHTEKKIPEDGGFVTKTLTVYFKDGYGKVSDGRGGMMYDPNKKRRTISFTGKLMPA